MTKYKCFECGKEINEDYLRKKIRCPYCGGRILFKPRVVTTRIKAR
ncbi:DNA-directed RNA polymerase subunit P [Candidatus Woesearchaeota archaeon]|nr:DNA-directed RNA polymerase subunit P [Candidatus Woesearchaeota archaeon]